ncbi:MAG: hypothetical protein ICV68_07025 [Pyrinomonadaceae bacterium]|nr:hypothetical protein [Pyrinomonadaceae bacterium]
MRGSRIAPWISIMAGLLWFYAAMMTNERRTLAVILGVVFLLVGLVQFKVNSVRFKEDESPTAEKDEG